MVKGKKERIVLENFINSDCFHNPNYKNYFINTIRNTINLASDDSKYFSLIFELEKGNELNEDVKNDIINSYQDIWFKIDSSILNDRELILNISKSNTWKNKALKYVNGILDSYNLNIDRTKLKNIVLYKIFERDDLQQAWWNRIRIKLNDLDLWDIWWLHYNTLWDRDYYSIYQRSSIVNLVLLELLLEWTIKEIKQQDYTKRVHSLDADYLITLWKDFSKWNIFNKLQEHLTLWWTTRSIKISEKNWEYLIEKEHVFIWDEIEKYIDLIKRFPHAEIKNNTYFGKSNRYIVKEKIKISKLEI